MREQNKSNTKPPFKKRSHSILPPPAILQAYEDLIPGGAGRIIEMAELEQAHRHEWEDNALKAYTKSNRVGQLFGLVIACMLIASASYLAVDDNELVAVIVVVSGFSSLAVTSLVALRARRYDKRPRAYRNKAEQEVI